MMGLSYPSLLPSQQPIIASVNMMSAKRLNNFFMDSSLFNESPAGTLPPYALARLLRRFSIQAMAPSKMTAMAMSESVPRAINFIF